MAQEETLTSCNTTFIDLLIGLIMEVISVKQLLVTLKCSSFSINLDPMKTLQPQEQEDTLTDPKWQTKKAQHSLAQEIKALCFKDKTRQLAISLLFVIT